MAIDKNKVTPAGQGNLNDVTAMNVVGIEREDGKGKVVIVIAETDQGKQYGDKECVMSYDLIKGVKFPASNGGKPENDKGMEVSD